MTDRKISKTENRKTSGDKFIEDVDYYFDDGLMVLTKEFLLRRGYCCGNGCRHCPYLPDEEVQLQKKSV